MARLDDAGTVASGQGAVPAFSRMIVFALAGALLLALVLRAYPLSGESAWNDEILSLRYLDAPDLATFMHRLADGDPVVRPVPVYFAIEYLWSRIVGTSVTAVRWLSVIFGVVSLLPMYRIARRFYGPWCGCLSAAWLATCLVHVHYSQEIRFYALVGLLALVSVDTLVTGLDRNSHLLLGVHVLVNALLLGTHLWSALLFAAQGLFLLTFLGRRRPWVVYWLCLQSALAVLWFMWLRFVEYFGVYDVAFPPGRPALVRVAMTYLIFAGGRVSNLDPGPYLPVQFSLGRLLGLAYLALFLVLAWNARRRLSVEHTGDAPRLWDESDGFHLLALWLVVPPVALFVLSWVWRPCFLYRYILYSAYPLGIAASAGVLRVRTKPLRTGLLVLFALAHAYQLCVLVRPVRPDYRSAAVHIQAHGGEDDLVIALKQFNSRGLAFSAAPLGLETDVEEGFAELCERVAAAHHAGRGAWVALWRWDNTEGLEDFLRAQGMERFTRLDFGGIPPLILYRVPG